MQRECCPFCTKEGATRIRVVDQQTFLIVAKQVHGDLYDYSKTEYKVSAKPVTITCKEHGDFQQTPSSHLSGAGCNKCAAVKIGDNTRLTLEDFVTKARAAHGDRYDYSKVDYLNTQKKVEIVCRKHGSFWQAPSNHFAGKGCRKCQAEKLVADRSSTTGEFILRATEIHNGFYDYSKVQYKGSHQKVLIICPDHGEFWQAPKHHLRGHRCERCGKDKLAEQFSFTKEEFIERAKMVHGGKFDYSRVEYVNCNSKVEIVCPIHGSFMQNAGSHLYGVGCRGCATTGFNKSKAGTFYVLTSETWVKVGITNRKVTRRVAEINSKSPEEFLVHKTYELDGTLCYDTEQVVLKWLDANAVPVPFKFQGSSESFSGICKDVVIGKIEELLYG